MNEDGREQEAEEEGEEESQKSGPANSTPLRADGPAAIQNSVETLGKPKNAHKVLASYHSDGDDEDDEDGEEDEGL